MNDDLFADILAKIERTNPQVDDLNSKIMTFFDPAPYEAFSEINSDGTEEVWKLRLTKPIPSEWAIICGEVLHNLRSALDHIACTVAKATTGSDKDTYFVFGKTEQAFEAELPKKAKRLPPDAIDLIRAAKPYPGGNDLLWAVHKLNIRDKHLSLIPVCLRPGIASFGSVSCENGIILILGSRHGQHLVMRGGRLTAPTRNDEPIFNPETKRVEFAVPNPVFSSEDMEFMTCTPGTSFETDYQPTFNVAFGDIESLKGQLVIRVFYQMRQLVEGIALTFRDRFA